MTTENTAATGFSGDEPIRADVTGEFTMNDFSIDPADQHIADAITKLDPVWDMPGAYSIQGASAHKLSQPTLASLPPHVADPIREQLARTSGLANAATEKQLVAKALYDLAMASRIKSGPGAISEGATPYHQEFFSIARDRQSLDDEFMSISSTLAEIDHVRHETDPATGERREVIVNRVEGERRRMLEARLGEINRSGRALEIEAHRRLQRALKESVDLQKSRDAAVAEEAEVERLTQVKVREDRILARVEKRASIRRLQS